MAQSSGSTLHSGYIGTGVYSQSHTDVFSFTINQAALARMKKPAAGMYGERRFMLNELAAYRLAAGIPTRAGNFGLNVMYQGSAVFNETNAGLAYARSLGSKADAGVQFNYYRINISSGYGKSSAISAEAGAIFHLSEKLHAGIHTANPVGGRFGKTDKEKLPALYSFGMGYEVSEKFYCDVSVEKEDNNPVNISAGLSYRPVPALLIKAGMSTTTSLSWLGAGLLIHSFRLNIIASYHPVLGITPGLMLICEFKKREK